MKNAEFAEITKIETQTDDDGFIIQTIVDLEFYGLDDHNTTDFDINSLGGVRTWNDDGNIRSGWVILDGPCKLKKGDTLPLRNA